MSEPLIVSPVKFVTSRKSGKPFVQFDSLKRVYFGPPSCPFCCQLENLPDELHRLSDPALFALSVQRCPTHIDDPGARFYLSNG
ncbi:unnamed protein product [Lasius platythorax]|uniref:Uncharacterized protein n=1 Tax=Lasius platythorax TaxID=488582 RepID=A0AAV2NCN4_9HYME